jgi:hypothetical protein
MNIRSTRNFMADGYYGAAVELPKGREFLAAVAAASSCSAGESFAGNYGRRGTDIGHIHHNEDGYDDGLVHSHGWAASDR